MGERALLVECADLAEVLALHAALVAEPLPGQREVLAAARTVLVQATDRRARERLGALLRELPVRATSTGSGRVLTIETVYDGADLAEVARLTGMSMESVVAAHTAGTWTAAFGGFAPGFAYLVGGSRSLDVPRRRSPRTAVPQGAVALAGHFSAVYPRSSPGGWQLIGRTDAPMWDLERTAPALVRPGDTVHFRAVRELVTGGRSAVGGLPEGPAAGATATPQADVVPVPRALLVLGTGPQSLVQDLGRPSLLDLGVSPSGAADRGAARQANRLVGNDRWAGVVETVLGGLEISAIGGNVLAVSGAPVGLAVVRDGVEVARPPTDAPFPLADGEVLRVDPPATGLRAYVAVRGGVVVPAVLRSRSTDLLSGIGPAPLAAGTVLPVGPPPAGAVGGPEPARRVPAGVTTVGVVLGPRSEWVTAPSLERFLGREWSVSERSNRVGLRLDGDPLERATAAELASEGTVAGAVQVPADGRPVVFLADHPVTGGYPVIAVVRDGDLDVLAQLRPGDRLRFSSEEVAHA